MAPSADPVPVTLPPAPDAGLASLYQEIILSHYRAPRHRGVLAGAVPAVEHRNPLCGDVLALQLEFAGDRITDAAFTARACSITQATASMLLDRLIGTSRAEALVLVARVEALIEASPAAGATPADELGDLRALASVARFPARRACVRLVTGAATEALTGA
ncbi:MAG: SUF system NifU family Fe-S cluster assembly protein [Gemmatimonadaceae bacterium]|nr:SUF system NifU family Fe-S cluster assembly protein [Gemmatimonadaceae bacterium]